MKLFTWKRLKLWLIGLLAMLLALWVGNVRTLAQASEYQDTFHIKGDYLNVDNLDSDRSTAFLGHGYPLFNLST